MGVIGDMKLDKELKLTLVVETGPLVEAIDQAAKAAAALNVTALVQQALADLGYKGPPEVVTPAKPDTPVQPEAPVDPVAPPPPVVTPTPAPTIPMPTNEQPIIVERRKNGDIQVRALAALGKLKYVLVDTEAHGWTWIGKETEFEAPFSFKPGWTLNGQRYKILTLDNSKWADSPVAEGLAPPKVEPVAANSGAGVAKDFLKDLKLGINIERARPVRMGLGPDYYQYLAGLGFTHTRFFPPYRWNAQMGWTGQIGDDQLNAFLDRVGAAIPAGKVFLDCFDVMAADEIKGNWPTVADFLKRVAVSIRNRGWSPQQIAVGPFNELEGGSNPDFNEWRNKAHSVLRAELPNHLIVHGASQWNGVKGWEEGNWELPPDDLVIGQIHHYGAPGMFDWSLGWKQFQARSAVLRDMPFVLAEIGDDFQHMDFGQHWGRWDALFTEVCTNGGGFKPMLWAMSGEGHDFCLNRGADDAHLQPAVEAKAPQLRAIIT